MTDPGDRDRALERMSQLLRSRYAQLGGRAAENLEQWLSGAVPHAYPEIIEQHLAEEHVGLVFDCFWQILPFGTGGRRGKVGYGPNRVNPAKPVVLVGTPSMDFERKLTSST
jgi:hypothetical protein